MPDNQEQSEQEAGRYNPITPSVDAFFEYYGYVDRQYEKGDADYLTYNFPKTKIVSRARVSKDNVVIRTSDTLTLSSDKTALDIFKIFNRINAATKISRLTLDKLDGDVVYYSLVSVFFGEDMRMFNQLMYAHQKDIIDSLYKLAVLSGVPETVSEEVEKSIEIEYLSEIPDFTTGEGEKLKEAKYPLTNQIKNHLEYFGYDVEFVKDDDADYLACRNKDKTVFVISIVVMIVLIRTKLNFDLKDGVDVVEVYKLFNAINAECSVSTWYVEKIEDGKVIYTVKAVYLGYEKSSFGRFLDSYLFEIARIIDRFDHIKK